MQKNSLNIVATENGMPSPPKTSRKQEAQAKFERLWLIEPEKFQPSRNIMGRERLERTWQLLLHHASIENKKVVDLGCGSGDLVQRLALKASEVHAVDIASNALKLIPGKANLKLIQDYVPRTKLEDNAYDIVSSTELIALLPVDDFRLYFSELARLVKSDGCVLISTPLDIQSEDALERFVALVDTEFHVHKWFFSYHYLYLKLCDFLKAPSRFVKAHQSSGYRRDALRKRHSIGRWWFKWNSTPLPAFFWSYFQYLTNPLLKLTEQSPKTLSFLEKISRFFWPESGISHVICIGNRHPLMPHLKESEIPRETKHKKQIWE